MADRNDILTYPQLIGISEFSGMQPIRVNSQDRHVVPGVLTHQSRRQLAAIIQLNIDLRSTVNGVPVRQYVTIRAVYEA